VESKLRPDIEHVTGTSADWLAEQTGRLRELFPEAFTEGKVDFDKLRAALGEEVDSRPERYSFSWAGKRDSIRLLQTPSRATLIPCPEKSVNFEHTGNIFIEGDNLEVLKLLYKSYFGRVKMIYIDPPYNTGHDFIYPDNFTDPLDTYLKLTGQKDSDGNLLASNPETNGRYHSAWLSMMYPRLFLARQLLDNDGVIFASIDDVELADLILLMNEVFGEENRVGIISWKNVTDNNPTLINKDNEFILCYARSKAALPQAWKSLHRRRRICSPGNTIGYGRLPKTHGTLRRKSENLSQTTLKQWAASPDISTLTCKVSTRGPKVSTILGPAGTISR